MYVLRQPSGLQSSTRRLSSRDIAATIGGTVQRAPTAGAAAAAPKLHQHRPYVAAAAHADEDDLMQHPDRLRWYEAKFVANDMPDWNKGELLASEQVAPGVKLLRISAEVSRERVPLRNAYRAAGQRASLRVGNGAEELVQVASTPPPLSLNKAPLFRSKGDIFANEIKLPTEPISIMTELEVVASKEEAPELYAAIPGEVELSVGPFQDGGLDLRNSNLIAMYRYPTLVLFVSGHRGIATARALLESSPDAAADLGLRFRQDVVLYYLAPNEASLLFKERFDGWRQQYGVRVETTTRSFQDAFDDDDQLAYDPETTGAIILTGGDEEAEAAAREVCREAEITEVVADSVQATAPEYLSSTPKSFDRWTKRDTDAAATAPTVSVR